MKMAYRERAIRGWGAFTLSVGFACGLVLPAIPANAPVRALVLKHRVEVVAPFAGETGREGVDLTVERSSGPPANSTQGVVIQRDEWATALDELKLVLGQSGVFRPTEPVPDELSSQPNVARPTVALHARFGRVESDFRVLLRLLQQADGALIAAAEGRAARLDQAMAQAVAAVEKEMLRRPWRCQVTELINQQLVIPFGRLDGLQRGQILTGFRLPEEVRTEKSVLSDLVLLKSGTKAGQYRVMQVTEELALLQPEPQAELLQPGDVLEAPAAPLHDLPRSSPSTLWDRIYQEPR